MTVALIIFGVLIIAADMLTKYLTVSNIALGAQVPLIDGVVHFTHLQNTGAAFSMLTGKTLFFILLTVAFLVIAFVAVKKKWLTTVPEKWALTAICAGAVGNLIDRIIHGYVIDMIEVEFIDFAVFNVADCFITCGAIALAIFVLTEKKK